MHNPGGVKADLRRERAAVLEAITGPGFVLIVRLPSTDGLDHVADALVTAGGAALEVALNTPGALEWLARSRDRWNGLVLGAGTVLSARVAQQALDAGARFLVAPNLCRPVVEAAHDRGALAIPGAFTPHEIVAAADAGADLVKLFPAGVGGPRYVADILAPLDDVALLPTGGIDESNVSEFIRAGAAAVGIGANVVNSQSVGERSFDDIATRLTRIRQLIAAARGPETSAPASTYGRGGHHV